MLTDDTATQVDTSAVAALGYDVEQLPVIVDRPFAPAYILRGKRGALYKLLRNAKNPSMLFAIKDGGRHTVVTVKGHQWFCERDGRLTPV
jgi:hypothetical protein